MTDSRALTLASASSVKYSARGEERGEEEETGVESSVVLWYHKTRATLKLCRKEGRRREKSQVGVVEESKQASPVPGP